MREVRVRRRKSRKRPSSTGTRTRRMKIPPLFRRLPHRRMYLLTTHNYRHREDSRRSQRTLPPERSHILSFHFRAESTMENQDSDGDCNLKHVQNS